MAAHHPLLENDEGEDTHDDDPSNMMVRAGYLGGLALKLEGEDRKMLKRAGRSLVLAAQRTAERPSTAICCVQAWCPNHGNIGEDSQ